MSELAEVHEDWRDETPVGHVEGEIDASNATMVGIRLRALVANHAFGLVVDLTATTYIDSAGINMLFVLGGELRARQQQLRLVVGPATPIARMLAVTGLDRSYPAHASLDEALATQGGGDRQLEPAGTDVQQLAVAAGGRLYWTANGTVKSLDL